jgi:hypothetical protein
VHVLWVLLVWWGVLQTVTIYKEVCTMQMGVVITCVQYSHSGRQPCLCMYTYMLGTAPGSSTSGKGWGVRGTSCAGTAQDQRMPN